MRARRDTRTKRFGTNLHPKQIPTKMHVIHMELFDIGAYVMDPLVDCLFCEAGSSEQKNYLIAAALYFERASCPVCQDRDGSIRKPPLKTYYDLLFEGRGETPEEIYGHIAGRGGTPEQARHIHKLVWQIADLVCPMMACRDEQLFVSEYAYAIDYVIRRNGDLPKPDIKHVFPLNYPDYDYTKGIAAEVQQYIEF